MEEDFTKELDIVPDQEGWQPEGYVQPEEDDVFVEHEHAHPFESKEEGDE